MSTALPTLETPRLLVRPFVPEDLPEVHRVLSEAWTKPIEEREATLPARERWLQWTIAGYEQLAELWQPPYGDRAVVRRDDNRLVGVVGLVPSLGPFGLLPGYPVDPGSACWIPEVGLFWAIDPAEQRKGYAAEAARTLIEQAFTQFHLARIIATTEYDNAASIGVMRKLGMTILRNPGNEPPWLQVVGLRVATGG